MFLRHPALDFYMSIFRSKTTVTFDPTSYGTTSSRDNKWDNILPFREGNLRGHSDLALAPLNSHHTTTKVAGFSVHLNAFLKKLLLKLTRKHLV